MAQLGPDELDLQAVVNYWTRALRTEVGPSARVLYTLLGRLSHSAYSAYVYKNNLIWTYFQ